MKGLRPIREVRIWKIWGFDPSQRADSHVVWGTELLPDEGKLELFAPGILN